MNIRDSYIHGTDGKGVVKSLYFATTAESVVNLSGTTYNTAAGKDLVFLLADGVGTKIGLPIPTFNQNTTGSAGSLKVVTRGTDANHYLTFVDSDNATATAENFYTDSDLYYNPSTNAFSAAGIIARTSFKYSGIAARTDDAASVVWFASTNAAGTPVYDNDFKYNPSTNTLTVGALSGPKIIIGETTLYINSGSTTNKLTPDTSISNTSTHGTIPSSLAVYNAILNGIASNDAMVFKGILTGGNTAANTTYTPAANCGWTYKVGTAGYINGEYYQVNDTFICTTDGTVAATSSNVNTIKANWAVVEGNGDYLSIHGGTMDGTLTIKTNNFGSQLVIERGDANGSAICYKNSSGVLGYVGFSSDKQLFRWNNDLSVSYLIADASNIKDKSVTLTTTLQTIATIAGVDIKAKITNYNSDNTAVKLGTAGATNITDGSKISVASSTGITFQGGTNSFKVGNGTNSITVSVGHGLSTKNMNINGTNYAIYTSASSLPTFCAPTSLAGTGGYILATNSAKNGLEWVAKPTSNVTTTAIVGSSASATTLISAAQSNPFYNLLEGGAVTRSIQFKAGTGITISASTGGVIIITNSAPDVNHNTDHRRAFYGTCDTAAATAAKVVTLSNTTGWELVAGTVIGVKFTNANSASNVTLAVNSEAAKSIFYNNAAYTGSSTDICGNAGRLTYYMYDGTYWVYIGNSYIINTSYSTMSLDEITTGTATSLRVMTAKIINDWLHTKNHTVSGTWTHSSSIVLSGTIGITSSTITDASGNSMLWYSDGNILGAFGDGTTATIPTYIRSTGNNLYHRKGKSGSFTDYLIADAGNVVNNNISVSWNAETTIATIAGIPIKIKIPANPNSNTWRNIYTGGTSRVGTDTNTKAMNFAVAGNLSVSYLAAGTSSGQSGSADYFTVKITANANAVGVAGYVAAPTKASNPNQVWMTNSNGEPAWRTVSTLIATEVQQLFNGSKTLAIDTWTNIATVNSLTAGTYLLSINSGNLYAAGTFALCGGQDAMGDEIALHVTSTASTWRPYARISGNYLQMTTSESSGTSRTYTIKILKLI